MATTILTTNDVDIIRKELENPSWNVNSIIRKLPNNLDEQAVLNQIQKIKETKTVHNLSEIEDAFSDDFDDTSEGFEDTFEDYTDEPVTETSEPIKYTIQDDDKEMTKKWTDKEINIVKEHYETHGAAKMLKLGLIKNRTTAAITSKANRLGLKAPALYIQPNENTFTNSPNNGLIDFNSVTGMIAILNAIKNSDIVQKCNIEVKFDDSLYFKYEKKEVIETDEI